jgi:sugar phosphate isomerase/epimerase
MRVGLCAWSFSGVHGKLGRQPDPWTAMGLAEMAATHKLAAVELSPAGLEALGPAGREEFMAEVAARDLTVVVDTGGKVVPSEIGAAVVTAVATAERFGSPVVRTTISQCLEGDRSRFGYQGWKDHLTALVAPMKEAAAVAADRGIAVGVENHQDICSSELVWLCEQVDSPAFGVVMDCGNALAVGEEPAAFADRVMPYLKHVHLKDYAVHPSPSGWRFVRCPIGAGVVDFADLVARFDAGAPGVLGCIELGATSARHVRLLDDDWWATFEPRPWESNLAAIRTLHGAQKDPGVDWRTPHERGEPLAAIANYELAQLEASVDYLGGRP